MNELHIFKENIYKMVFPIIKLEFLRFFSGNYPQQYIICNYIINFRLTKSLNLYQRYVINLISFSILGGIMKISHNECINYSILRYFLVLFPWHKSAYSIVGSQGYEYAFTFYPHLIIYHERILKGSPHGFFLLHPWKAFW